MLWPQYFEEKTKSLKRLQVTQLRKHHDSGSSVTFLHQEVAPRAHINCSNPEDDTVGPQSIVSPEFLRVGSAFVSAFVFEVSFYMDCSHSRSPQSQTHTIYILCQCLVNDMC